MSYFGLWSSRKQAITPVPFFSVYVVTAVDGDGMVKEQDVFLDHDEATMAFTRLREIWGGDRVCLMSRAVKGVTKDTHISTLRG